MKEKLLREGSFIYALDKNGANAFDFNVQSMTHTIRGREGIAAFIVKACNMHEELVEELKKMSFFAAKTLQYYGQNPDDYPELEEAYEVRRKAEATK